MRDLHELAIHEALALSTTDPACLLNHDDVLVRGLRLQCLPIAEVVELADESHPPANETRHERSVNAWCGYVLHACERYSNSKGTGIQEQEGRFTEI